MHHHTHKLLRIYTLFALVVFSGFLIGVAVLLGKLGETRKAFDCDHAGQPCDQLFKK